jgi:hypothetical protein
MMVERLPTQIGYEDKCKEQVLELQPIKRTIIATDDYVVTTSTPNSPFFLAMSTSPSGPPFAVFRRDDVSDEDRSKIVMGARFVHEEYYEDTYPRSHCWSLRFT